MTRIAVPRNETMPTNERNSFGLKRPSVEAGASAVGGNCATLW